MRKDDGYTVGDILKITGVNRHKVFYWGKTWGMIRPGIFESDTTGKKSVFTWDDVRDIIAIRDLYNAGLRLRVIQEIMKSRHQF
jgi:DNA-binding transcriptional MerR regulator